MTRKKKRFFDPESSELVKFTLNGDVKYFPVQFFAISDYLYELLEGCINGNFSYFEESLANEEQKWLSKKVDEWKDFYLHNKPVEGGFWGRIIDAYNEAGEEIPGWCEFQSNRAFNLDLRRSRENLKYVLTQHPLKEEKSCESCRAVYDEDAYDEDAYDEFKKFIEEQTKTNTKTNTKTKTNKIKKGEVMRETIGNVKNVVVDEVRELINTSGAADIALGRMLYNNIKASMGRTIVKIGFVDRMVAKVSKKMKYKNEVTELMSVLAALVVLKQFYDHKALENVRGYIVNRLYTIGIEATGADDIIALMKQTESQTQAIND